MEIAIQRTFAIALVVLGLSHLLQPMAWVRLFIHMREKGEAGVLAIALLHFCPGVLIVSFHNVWQGVPVVLTFYGWLLVIKSTLYFLCPAVGLKSLALVREKHARKFGLAGVPMVMLGLFLAWGVLSK